jgi:hypothetical protein
MGLLQEKLKGVDVEPVCGSKCDMYETDCVSLFDHGIGFSLKKYTYCNMHGSVKK